MLVLRLEMEMGGGGRQKARAGLRTADMDMDMDIRGSESWRSFLSRARRSSAGGSWPLPGCGGKSRTDGACQWGVQSQPW